MALNFRNFGQRLLDSTTLDEKVGDFFRPKTGTLASTGRKWAQELAAKPLTQNQQRVAEVPIGAMRGVTSALTGFTGLENRIAPKLGLGTFTSIKPQYAPGKVAEVAGAIGGSLIPAAPVNQLARLIKPVGTIRTAQKFLGNQAGKMIAQKGLTGLGGRALANVSQGIPFTAGFALAQKIGGQDYGGKQLAGDVGFDAAAGALIPGAAATLPLLMGITKNKADLSKVLKNEAGVMALIKRMTVLDKMGTAGYQQTKDMVQKAVDVLAPDLAKNRELNKLKDGINADEWMKTVTNVLQDRLVAAKTGDYTLAGMSTRAMGKIDTPKLSVEPTGETPLYHGTTPEIAQKIEKAGFDVNQTADGSIWFTDKKDALTSKEGVGASGKGGIVERILPKNLKMATPEMKDKYYTDQLIQMGYDGVKYPDEGFGQGNFYQLFSPEKLSKSKPLSVEPVGGKPIKVYRGEGSGVKRQSLLGDGTYVTEDPNIAKSFGPNVKEYEIVGNPKLLEADSPEFRKIKNSAPVVENERGVVTDGKYIADRVVALGYDGVKGSGYDGISIYNKKFLKESSPSPLGRKVEPVGGKPDISNKVQQNIDSGMSVDEAVRKAQSETTTPIKNKSSKFTSAEEYARDEGVRAKAGIVSEKQRSDFFGSEGIPNGYNARSFYENRMRKAGFSEDQISKVLSRVEERPGTGAGAGMKSEDVADAMAEHNLSIRDQLRAEYNQSSPLGGKVGEVISTTKPLSVEPVGGEVKTVTPIRKPLKEVYLNKLNQPAELPKVPESLTTTTGLSKVSPTIQSTQRSLREPSQPLSSQDQLKSLTRVTPISSKNVASPDILPSTVKSRGLTESVQQAQNIVPEVKSGVTGTYTPKPNAQLMAEAQTLLNEGGTVDLSKVKNADQKVAATIQEAINAQQAGDHQLAANLFNNLSEQGTELGRGVQAFSLLEKMSPEAVSLSAAGQIKKYNATHSAKLPELTGDQSKLIADKVANIRTMPDGRDKNIALNEVNQIINSFIPSSLADKAITIWKAGLLTSLRTHLRNQIGNSVHTGMEIAKDVLATPIDVMLSGATGQRTKTLTVKGMGEFGSQSTRQQIMDIMSKGFDPTQQINKFDHRQVNWGNNPVEKVLKVYTDLVFRSLGAADKPYYNSVLARSLYDQAGASAINAGRRGDIGFINDLVKNPTDGMLKIAINDANVATFKDKNTYSKVANAIKQSMVQAGQEYGGDFGRESSKILTEFVAPFTGVPSSIAGQIVAYSPVGLVKGIAKAGKVIVNKIPDLQRQAVEEIGRGGIGTAVMALGAYLASKGMVTGQPKDAAEQRQWDLENKPRNSIFINGKWRSLNSIGPEALVFLAGAKADEEMNNPEGSLSKYAGTLIKDQLDQSFVQGIQGPVNAITDPQRYAKSYIGNSVSSFVPNIIKDVSKSIDPYARETNTTGDYVKASIPGLRNTLVNKRDTLGRVINQEPTGAAAFVDVFNSKTPVSNPVVQEFSRLNDSGFNVAPGKIGKAQTINGQKVNLNPQELDQFEQKVGQVAMPSLQQLISSPSYQSSDDENKSKQIDSLMTKIRAQVRSGNLETVTQTVKKIVTKKVKKVSSKKPKTVKKISAPKLSKFNLASKVRKVKRIRTKQYKLQIPK